MSEHAESAIDMYDKYISVVDWLKETNLPVAITLTEILQPSEGREAIVFPPTFAVDKKAEHPYQVDIFRSDIAAQAAKPGEDVNTCLIDSIGSQANRMEPWFRQPPLSKLVPQINVKLKTRVNDINTTVDVNLLDVGHRVADGAVRFSVSLREKVTKAIQAMMSEANAEPLARLAPTSLVFGFWDSRPDTTMFKHGRLLRSEIRASNIAVVKRSAQFNPAFDPSLIGLSDEVPEDTEQSQSSNQDSGKSGDGKDPLSKLGLRAAPAVGTHGGIRVYGQIVRRTHISLVGLRALAVTERSGEVLEIDPNKTLKLRRYLLGLALVAACCQANYALREGCLLVRTCEPEARLVYTDTRQENFDWHLEQAFEYVRKAALEFGVESQPQYFDFDSKKAKAEAEKLKSEKGKGKKK